MSGDPIVVSISLPAELIEVIAQRAAEIRVEREPAGDDRYLDKRELAAVLSVSVRWIEERLREGMPSTMLAGRRKFQRAEVERWLEAAGHLQRGRYRGRVPANRGRAATTTATTAREEIMPPANAAQTSRREGRR